MTADSKKSLGWQRSDGSLAANHLPFSQMRSRRNIRSIYLIYLGLPITPASIPGRFRRFCSWNDPPSQIAILAFNSLKKSQIALSVRLLLHQVLSLQAAENKDQSACL
jgi:hypothetical protein